MPAPRKPARTASPKAKTPRKPAAKASPKAKPAATATKKTPTGRRASPKAAAKSKSDSRPRRRKGALEVAIARDIKALHLPADGATEGLQALALAMGREIDSAFNSATAKSMCGRIAYDVMDRLRELAPTDQKPDEISEFERRMNAKRNRAA